MGESFEAKLIASSAKEVFKKAKHILHNGGPSPEQFSTVGSSRQYMMRSM